jgi:quinol monooxygenase YgiN
MVVARIVKFYFKDGKREEGFEELDLILNKQVRSARGFRGYITSFSCDQDNEAFFLTMWEDNESFEGSSELFSFAIDKVKPFFERPPYVEHHRIDTVNFNP